MASRRSCLCGFLLRYWFSATVVHRGGEQAPVDRRVGTEYAGLVAPIGSGSPVQDTAGGPPSSNILPEGPHAHHGFVITSHAKAHQFINPCIANTCCHENVVQLPGRMTIRFFIRHYCPTDVYSVHFAERACRAQVPT